MYFRALQGHSGRNLIDSLLQDNVVIQGNFFQYIYHVGCAFNLHSIISSGLIPGVQSLSKRQEETSRRSVVVDINIAIAKRLIFYQTRSNAIVLQETFSSYCIPKVVRMETGEFIYEKVFMSPRPPLKISLRHDWTKELGSEHAQRSEVGQLSKSFQSNQPIQNPIRERTERPVVKDDARTVQDGRKTSRSQEIDVSSFHEELVSSERRERPVIETRVTSTFI